MEILDEVAGVRDVAVAVALAVALAVAVEAREGGEACRARTNSSFSKNPEVEMPLPIPSYVSQQPRNTSRKHSNTSANKWQLHTARQRVASIPRRSLNEVLFREAALEPMSQPQQSQDWAVKSNLSAWG